MMEPVDKALVLAAGNGDRFRNPTRESKLLQPVLGRPLTIRTIETARDAGITAFEIVLGYRPDILTSEGKTMNGSAQKRQTVHRPAWGGRAGGSVSVLAPSGSKESPRGGCGRTLANGTRGRRTHE